VRSNEESQQRAGCVRPDDGESNSDNDGSSCRRSCAESCLWCACTSGNHYSEPMGIKRRTTKNVRIIFSGIMFLTFSFTNRLLLNIKVAYISRLLVIYWVHDVPTGPRLDIIHCTRNKRSLLQPVLSGPMPKNGKVVPVSFYFLFGTGSLEAIIASPLRREGFAIIS
jgi:hypothetical protein